MTNLAWIRNPLGTSLLLHGGFLILIGLLTLRPDFHFKKKIDFEVIQYPVAAPATVQINPPKEQVKPAPPPQRAVFGVSRRAITSADSSAAEIKQGNTVAKEQDNLTLNKEDADSLPIPTDDYLVTAMPKMKSEFRIPYPEAAKKAGIEGPVVMDLLIDDQGHVRKVELFKGPGFGLNEAAVEAAHHFEFIAARVADKPVAVKIRYVYRFVLENR